MPFFVNYGFHLRVKLKTTLTIKQITREVPNLLNEVTILSRLDKFLRHKILYAQDVYKEFANRKWAPTLIFNLGK